MDLDQAALRARRYGLYALFLACRRCSGGCISRRNGQPVQSLPLRCWIIMLGVVGLLGELEPEIAFGTHRRHGIVDLLESRVRCGKLRVDVV